MKTDIFLKLIFAELTKQGKTAQESAKLAAQEAINQSLTIDDYKENERVLKIIAQL